MQIQRQFEENYRIIVKLAIVISVLLFSVAVAFVDSPRVALLPFMAVFGVAFLLLFLRQPQIGILLMVFSTFLVPSPLGTSGVSRISPAMFIQSALLALWLLDMVARQRRIYLAPSRTTLPLVLLMVWTVIALINAQINYYFIPKLAPLNAQVSQVMIYVLSGMAFLLAGNRMVSLVWLRRILWLFVVLGAFYVFGILIIPIRRFVLQIFQFGSTSSLFWVWLVAILSSQLLLNHQLSKTKKVFLGIILVAALYTVLIFTYEWKSGWLPSLVALLVIVFIGFPRIRALAIFMGIIILIMGFTRIGNFVSGGEDYSLSTREEAYGLYLQIVKVSPIFGLGPANVYYYTPLFPIRGYAVNYNSHNNYIDILAQFGVVGLIIFFWLAWEIGYLGWRLKDFVRDDTDRAYVIGALGGLVGMLVSGVLGDWIFPFVYNVGMVGYRSSMVGWIFLGGLVFLEQLYMRNGNKEALNPK